MAHKKTLSRGVILRPNANCLVPTATGKVVTVRTPRKAHDGTIVTAVDAEAGPDLEGPEADLAIGGARDEQFGVRLGFGTIALVDVAVEVGNGIREGDTVDRAGVADELAIVDLKVLLGRQGRRQGLAVH